MTDHRAVAANLSARLKELTSRSDVIVEDLRHPLDADSSEQAIDLADDEALAGVDDVLRQEIRQIKAALLRIESGTYGTCVKCGGDIGAERLKALPSAPHCIDCA